MKVFFPILAKDELVFGPHFEWFFYSPFQQTRISSFPALPTKDTKGF